MGWMHLLKTLKKSNLYHPQNAQKMFTTITSGNSSTKGVHFTQYSAHITTVLWKNYHSTYILGVINSISIHTNLLHLTPIVEWAAQDQVIWMDDLPHRKPRNPNPAQTLTSVPGPQLDWCLPSSSNLRNGDSYASREYRRNIVNHVIISFSNLAHKSYSA